MASHIKLPPATLASHITALVCSLDTLFPSHPPVSLGGKAALRFRPHMWKIKVGGFQVPGFNPAYSHDEDLSESASEDGRAHLSFSQLHKIK